MRHRVLAILLMAAAIAHAGSVAKAEMEKIATPSENGLSLYWWPKLAPIEGWQHDRKASFMASSNILVPEGDSFADAETVMYARAMYKPRNPEVTSVQILIEGNEADFLAREPDLKIEEVAPVVTGDGVGLRSFTYSATGKGNWERVSFGEEGDYYLTFVISSRTLEGYQESLKAYRQMISSYRE